VPGNIGGGIVAYNNALGEKLVIRNCIVSGNYAVSGGGMANHTGTSPLINYCSFTGNTANKGGGIYNYNDASPTVMNSEFSSNEALEIESGGAGMYNDNSSPVITGSSFSGNNAYKGGGIYSTGSSAPEIKDCLFSANNARGGALYNFIGSDINLSDCVFVGNSSNGFAAIENVYSSFLIVNCVFIDNNVNSIINNNYIADTSGIYNNTIFGEGIGTAIYNTNSNIQIKNNILWSGGGAGIAGNSSPVVAYNIIRGGYAGGTNNTDVNPLFVNTDNPVGEDGVWGTADDGLALSSCSPAINIGNNTGIPEGVTTDITGNPRIYGWVVDMGAYESQSNLQPSALYVDAVNGDDENPGTGWGAPFKTLSHAMDIIQNTSCYSTVDSIFVAKGTYYPGQVAGYTLKAFLLLPNVKMYGGFQPGGTGGWEEREPGTSILSGDVDGNG